MDQCHIHKLGRSASQSKQQLVILGFCFLFWMSSYMRLTHDHDFLIQKLWQENIPHKKRQSQPSFHRKRRVLSVEEVMIVLPFRYLSYAESKLWLETWSLGPPSQIPSTQLPHQEFPMPDKGIICISGGNGALGLVMGNWLLDKARVCGGALTIRHWPSVAGARQSWRQVPSCFNFYGGRCMHRKS